MPIKLTDEQYLLWIKDPSISPYLNKYVYTKANIYNNRTYRKNILTANTINNPKAFLNQIIMKAISNISIRQKIIDKINEYKINKIPRLYTENDKWKYDEQGLIDDNMVNIDYDEPYFSEDECKEWVRNHLVNPKTQDVIKKLGYIYIELLYTTLQYGIDVSEIEYNLSHYSSSNRINLIESIRTRLKFMQDTDELFLNYDIKHFDDLLKFRSPIFTHDESQKSKNTFSVSSYSPSSPIKSINSAEKEQLKEMAYMQEKDEEKIYEYTLQKNYNKKLRKKLQKDMDMQNINRKIFSSLRTFLQELNEEIWDKNDKLYNDILNNINTHNMTAITSVLRADHDKNPNSGGTTEDLSNNKDNMFRIARRFIIDIYAQLLNPRYKLYKKIETFSYINQTYHFNGTLLIRNITSALLDYVNNNPALDEEIKTYFLMLVQDKIPVYFVSHSLYNREQGQRDKRKKINNYRDDYENVYYTILYNNNKSDDSNIQYRLPVGKGFINGKILMRKFASIDHPELFRYFNDNVSYKMITADDDDNNDFTYEECKDWVIMPIINPRTFERITLDTPLYNRLLCMTYQYDCNLIPRMITSRGYEIIKALVHIIKNILAKENKQPQTREELERYILDRQFLREKGAEFMKVVSDVVGLKWKDYGGKKPSDRIDITENNVALVSAMELKIRRDRIASRSSQDPVAFYVFFTEEELNNLQVTNLTADSFIKVKKHYYIPVVNKAVGVRRPKNPIARTIYHVRDKHYSIVNCMMWAMHPNRDPKIPTQLIVTDSKEYKEIFEQALMYDSNIQPIGITPEGIEFKKQILKIKKKNFKILKVQNKKPEDEILPETMFDIINKNEICGSINNIYTYTSDNEVDEKYLYFKKKMLKMCEKYLGKKENCNLPNINKKINDLFVKKKKSKPKKFVYFEDSALASIIVDYEKQYKQFKLYNEDAQNNYINNYKNIYKVSINEILLNYNGSMTTNDKGAVDIGGVSREFFTNLFEELFCDEVNTKRPFILSEEKSIANKYYINPNFEPDEKFRKVINYAKIHIKKTIPDYNTDEDYQNIYYIIGKVLSVTLVNIEIGTPKPFSSYILSRFINPQKNLKNYDILYFYLQDFNNSTTYINMMNEQLKNTINSCGFSFNDYYIITKASQSNPLGRSLTKENYPKYMLQLAKHVVTKNFIFDGIEGSKKNMKGRYDSLFAGFNNEIRTFLYNNNVSIDMLDKLITNEQLNEAILLEFAEKLKISVIKFVDNNAYNTDIVPDFTEQEKQAIIAELRICMTNIITIKRMDITDEEHYKFIRRLLQFWTGFNYYDKHAESKENGYKLFYFYGTDVRQFPSTHTCFYQLDFFGFPYDKTILEEKEEYLYERLNESIENAPGMEMA